MEPLFVGQFEHQLDEKGRLAIASPFRKALLVTKDKRLVVTNFRVESIPILEVYPYPSWLRLTERIRQQPPFDPRVQRFNRYYIARAHLCELDGQGRILIPPRLREYAHLDRSVVVMAAGGGDRLQIWDRNAWLEIVERDDRHIAENPEEFHGMAL
ncbi:MAG: transcriptional regulator MraZ [Candidatus Binatia bacterium]|nr:MAG: transcriptional regulator MraZ [Candidatus Binatia bacterium]